MRLFEKHPNGSVFDAKSWRRKDVLAAWAAWHGFQDRIKGQQRPTGFVKEEENV